MRKDRFVCRGLAFILCLSMLVGFVPAESFAGLIPVSTVSAEGISAQNIVKNSGFDSTSDWKTSVGAQATIAIADGIAKVTAAVAGEDAKKSNAYITQSFDDVEPYEAYELTVKYKWMSGDSKPYISLWFYSDGTYCGGSGLEYCEDKTGEWVTVTTTAIAPAGTDSMTVELGNNTGATVTYAFDEVSVVKTGSYAFAETFEAYNSNKAEEGPVGWQDNDVYNAGLVTGKSGTEAYSGSALHFQQVDGLWAKGPSFNVKAGYDYTVEFMAKKSQHNGHFTGYAEVIFLDQAGNEVGSYSRIVGKTYGAWTKESFLVLAPAGAVKAYFIFACQTSAGAYGVDSLTVTQSAAPSTRDPGTEDPDVPPVYTPSLLNPGFEEGVTGWTNSTGAGATATVVTEGAYSGQKALQIAAKPTETQRAACYKAQTLDIAGIDAIEVSVMSKRLSGDGKAYMMLAFYDEGGNLVPDATAYMETIATEMEWTKTTRIRAFRREQFLLPLRSATAPVRPFPTWSTMLL